MAEEEKDTNEDGVKPSGGSKKLLVIGLIAGLVVGGGGAAGYFIMQPSNDANHEAVAQEVVEKAPELPDFQYARIDKLNLPLFYKGRVLNYAVTSVSLETIGNDDKLIVVKNIIIIKDALLRYFSINAVGREDNPRIVDFDKLASKIKEVANQEIGREIVTRVVISETRNF